MQATADTAKCNAGECLETCEQQSSSREGREFEVDDDARERTYLCSRHTPSHKCIWYPTGIAVKERMNAGVDGKETQEGSSAAAIVNEGSDACGVV